MRKVYGWMPRQNSASIILTGKGGNRVRYDFTGGSVMQNVNATFMTDNEYFQQLLEDSDYVKKGLVRVKQVIKSESTTLKRELTAVDDVVSARLAIEWVANTFGEQTTSKATAVEAARKRGYYFPNLK